MESISFSRTTTSLVIGSTMLTRLTRPRIDRARLTSTFSPLETTPFVIPCEVPQSPIVMTTSCATSASSRVG